MDDQEPYFSPCGSTTDLPWTVAGYYRATHDPVNNMRIFVGTSIALSTSNGVMEKAREELAAPYWRVAPLAQWHVTTLFIGERPEPTLQTALIETEKLADNQAPIVLLNGRITTMPKQDPTMLWVRFQPNPELTALHVALAEATGTEPSIYRPYWPHITLARAKAGKPAAVDGDVVLPYLLLDHLTLFHSKASPEGSIHAPMASWPLSGTGPAALEAAD